MKKLISILIFSIFAIMSTALQIFAQIPDTANSYTLKFHDEFNDTVINTNLWRSNAHYGNNAYKLNCSEPADTFYWCDFYTPSFANIECTGTSIKLVSKRENYYDSGYDTTFRHTTARLFSRKQFRYGYFEISMKLPNIPSQGSDSSYEGISTNFWMFEARDSVPYNVSWSEIDGYEINCRDNKLTNNAHFGQSGYPVRAAPYDSYPSPLVFNGQFRKFSFEWNADSIIYYLDGNRISATALFADSLIAMPLYIDMNIDHNQFCEEVDTIGSKITIFPYKVEVDYIRVYQRKLDLDTNKTYCNNVNNHDFNLYKSITAEGSGCSDVVTNKSSFPMESTDYILLNAGFEASATSNLFINVMKSLAGQVYSQETHDSKGNVTPPQSWFDRLKYKILY